MPDSTALTKRAADAVALMPPPPLKKIKRPPKVLDEDDYTDALSNIIARDYFPGLRETQAQQEYLSALESNDQSWIAEAASKLREAATPSRESQVARQTRDKRFDSAHPGQTPTRAPDTPLGHDGSETPQPTPSSPTIHPTEPEPPALDTNTLSLSSFQSIYTSEDNASFNDVLDKQNTIRRKKHTYLWTPDQRIPSKRLLLHRANEQKHLTAVASDTAIAKAESRELVPMSVGATDSRSAKPEGWKSKSPTNNFMFNASSVDEEGLPTAWEQKEANSKAGPRMTIHENTRFPPLQYVDDYDETGRPSESPSLNTQIIEARDRGEYEGGMTPRVNGYSYVDEDEPEAIPPVELAGPTYRDLLAGQTGEAMPNPFKLSASQKREELHHRMVEETNRRKRAKELETKKDGLMTPGVTGKEQGNMTPAARKLMEKLGRTPVRAPMENAGAKEMWTPVRTPRRVK